MQTIFKNPWVKVLFDNSDGKLVITTNFIEHILNINSYIEESLQEILYCSLLVKNNDVIPGEEFSLIEEEGKMQIKAQIINTNMIIEVDHDKNELIFENISTLPDFTTIKNKINELVNAY
ncbi:MAG: hypothetical protein PHS65_01400 [Arcobacteraceae bacterium]|nr:hypothetical protein [Arcobacteraceae bacterium]